MHNLKYVERTPLISGNCTQVSTGAEDKRYLQAIYHPPNLQPDWEPSCPWESYSNPEKCIADLLFCPVIWLRCAFIFYSWGNVTDLSTQCKVLTSLTETLSMLCCRKSCYFMRARSQHLPWKFHTSGGVFGEWRQGLQREEWGWSSRCAAQATLGTYLKEWVPSSTGKAKSGWLGSCLLSSWWHIPMFHPLHLPCGQISSLFRELIQNRKLIWLFPLD